jgi:hypothetical protein
MTTFAATYASCEWEYSSDAEWLTHRVADIHRGVHNHAVEEVPR